MDVKNYVVTLGVRPADMRGLKELPGTTKDNLTPLILLAPWLATKPLSRALDKFQKSYPSRPYFIDVDTYYQINDKPNDAKELWERLAQKPADLDAWWDLLSEDKNANPCLLMAEQPIERVREQIEWARENNRIFCLRINLAEEVGGGVPPWFSELAIYLENYGANDYVILFEFGEVVEPLQVAAITINYIDRYLSNISPDVTVVVSCTSFPRDFRKYDGLRECPFSNRLLIEEIRKRTRHKIIYGDWGSTKPRKHGHANQPKYRIDYPTDNSWLFARNQGENISFKEAARRITKNHHWSGKLGIWGEQLIADTAKGHDFAIDTMPKMYAARINIHLHRQAFHGGELPENLDEEWSDDDL